MTRFVLSQFVIYLTAISAELCSVDNCIESYCKNNSCTQCDASYFLTSDGECAQLFLSCQECDGKLCYYTCAHTNCDSDINNCTCSSNTTSCSACPDGYYKESGECKKCHYHNCLCLDHFGCSECIPGYYGTLGKCTNNCPINCKRCESMGNCIECIAGKYGQQCQDNCPHVCADGTCDKVSGLCPGTCANGQYLGTNNICEACSPRCNICTDYQNCSSCNKQHYWGNYCQYDCTGCYKNCVKDIGCSGECVSPYYKSYDNTTAGYICTRCPASCANCSNSTQCNVCKTGHWGSYCQYACLGCNGSCDKHNGCNLGCTNGYYRRIIAEGGFLCEKCLNNCLNCRNSSSCYECDSGYYISNTLICTPCPVNCNDKTCYKNNGTCTAGCKTGWSGERCDKLCPSKCKQCEPFCNACQTGFFGDKCEYGCSMKCEEQNGLQTCNKTNGACFHGCKTGYWGLYCNMSCEIRCENEKCNDSTGLCLNGCKKNLFGIRCDKGCSPTCKRNSQTSRQCDESSGNCESGCQNGWFGDNCTAVCDSACISTKCLQHSGACVYGQASDSSEITSTTVNTEHQEYSQPPRTSGNLAVPIGAGAGAAVVIALALVILVLFIRRRRVARKQEQPRDTIFIEDDINNPCKDDVAYATVNKQPKATINVVEDSNAQLKGNVTYAAVNKQSKDTINVDEDNNTPFKDNGTYAAVNKKKRASEILSETIILNDKSSDVMSTAHGNVADDGKLHIKAKHKPEIGSLKANTKSNRKPTSKLAKENPINAKEPLSIEMDSEEVNRDALQKKEFKEILNGNTSVENDTTYYNTVTKLVTVSGLAEYLKNKDQKMIEKEFQKLPRGLQKEHVVAENPRNAAKNRYKQIYPYDESRVILQDGGNDYVNASFIKGGNRPKEYIASSGPFQRGTTDNETVSDLWRIVWQEQCVTIVMLTKCYENEEQKCEQYWPELGSSKQHASLYVTCVTEDQYADFIIRSFVVTKDGKHLNTRQLQFTAWPDKGVPADVTSMIEFRQKVRSLHKGAVCPMLVHCSAGIGRTGTFIALDIQTDIGESSGYVDLFACVAELRNQRVNLVQTPEQYVYLHHAVLHALTFDSQSMPAEKFIETYSRMIKKKEGQSHIERQLKKLQSTIDEISAEDKKTMDQNRAFTDKNRNGADIPGDEYRVILHGHRKPGYPNYINAVYINGFRSRNNFIAAQIPLPTTLVDFLSLIFQEKCSRVVMMEEVDTQNKTVGVFWPADNQVLKHGVFQVRCKGSKTSQTYKLKELSIESRTGKTAETLDVDLYIYTDWPKEAAVPQSSDSLLQLVKDVGTHNCQQEKDAPVLILCMTGAARSCLFCAVSVLIEKMEIEHEVSVVNTLRQIKARRRSAIPTLEQYKFCHQAVISYLQTFDIYSNFGLKEKEAN